MNWYKIAQRKSRFKELIKGFTAGSLIGLFSYIGVTNLLDAEKKFVENPKEVTNAIQVVQQEKPSQINEAEVVPPKPSINIEEISNMIKKHEGIRNKVYYDTEKKPTIGIGFNLEKEGAKERLIQLGVDINNVLRGQELTNVQINKLFQDDLKIAISDAKSFLPNFDQQPEIVKNILVDMSFNLGYTGLSGFEDFRKALLNNDYIEASKEMIDSDWYSQVGNRSKELVSLMERI